MGSTMLSRFSPGLMTPTVLEDVFVQREGLARRLVELIEDSVLTTGKHHSLVVGPRGIGKTHLVSLVRHRVAAKESLRERLAVAWLREDEWGITSFRDLMIRLLETLADEDRLLAERIQGFYSIPADQVEHAAEELLLDHLGPRTLLVIIENLDDVFSGMGDREQKRLRAHIQEHGHWTLLATTQSLFSGVSEQASPFYGFFHVHHLEELGQADARALLVKLAIQRGDPELASFIKTPTGNARVAALLGLAGGNHRIYTILSEFLTEESLDDLVEPFIRMLDDLTPYYQERMKALSPQQRKIVEMLCTAPGAQRVKELANRCFITHQTASSQLSQLKAMGYVKPQRVGRDVYYELREPLMRLCVDLKQNRGKPIQLLVRLLRFWFSRDELERRRAALPIQARLEREYLGHAIQSELDDSTRAWARDREEDFIRLVESGDHEGALVIAREMTTQLGAPEHWVCQGRCLFVLHRLDDAIVAYTNAIEHSEGKPLHRNVLVGALAYRSIALGNLGRGEEATSDIERASAIGTDEPYSQVVMARAWALQGSHRDALRWAESAIAAGEMSTGLRFERANSLIQEGRHDEGIEALCEIRSHVDQVGDVDDDTFKSILGLSLAAATPALLHLPLATLESGRHASSLVALAAQEGVLVPLGGGLLVSIRAFLSPLLSKEAGEAWLDIWRPHAERHPELAMVYQALDAALNYQDSGDERFLLELSPNNRKIVEGLLDADGRTTT